MIISYILVAFLFHQCLSEIFYQNDDLIHISVDENYQKEFSGPTEDDVMNLTEELYKNDVNNVGDLITYDLSLPGPLFTEIPDDALTRPTISTFLSLIDNYYHSTKYAEVDTSQEQSEKKEFLDAVMKTSVMKLTEKFLNSYGLIDTPLRNVLDDIFFSYYPRDKQTLGSSGFEHSFMGEIDENEVVGFHNWISFSQNEQNGTLVYKNSQNELRISNNVTLLEVGFQWYNYDKRISGILIGSSPEYELALYTVCFFTSRNKKCRVSTNGKKYRIQTWSLEYNGQTYVATAYPLI